MDKPKIRIRNKPLFAAVEPDFTLWTVYIPNRDGEMAYVIMYDHLLTSRRFVENMLGLLYKEWKKGLVDE
jgi:hypothetical protein